MAGEIIFQRVLHPDPYGEKESNYGYAQDQYKKRLAEHGLDGSPIIQVALQVANHYREGLSDEPRWRHFGLGDHAIDFNVASHQLRQTMLFDISADCDGLGRTEREVGNAASIIHDLGEIGIDPATGKKVSDISKPIKMKDPRKYELVETEAALKLIRESGLDPQERDALMEVYWRIITSEISPDEYQQMSGASVGAWPAGIDWAELHACFDISEFYGYKLTAVDQLLQLNRPVVLTPEEAFRVTHWTDQDVTRAVESSPELLAGLFEGQDMRRLFVYKCGWVRQIVAECEAGRSSALYFAERFHLEMEQGKAGLDLGIDLDQICPGSVELAQAIGKR